MEDEISAGAVVFRRSKPIKYILLHYKFKSEYWDFPRGNIEKGETVEQTAIREVEEETGLKFDLIPGFKEKIKWFFRRDGKIIAKQVTYLLAEARNTDVKISMEHLGYTWLEFEDAIKRLKFDSSRSTLTKANRFINSVRTLSDF